MNANMDAPKIKTYSKRQPVVSYKSSLALVLSYPDPQANVRESRLNDKTLVIDSPNDTFDKIFETEKLGGQPQKEPQNDFDGNTSKTFFKKPLFEKLKKVKKSKRKDKLDNQENLTNINLDKPKKKRQKNVAKDKVKKTKQKVTVNVKKNVLLKGIENLQLKECSINLNKCSTGYNICNSHEVVEINDKQNSANVLGEFNKSNDLNNFSQYLKPVDNLLSSTPRDHKPRMVVNVQNISPITLHKDNRHTLKKRVSILLPGEKAKQSRASNGLKELSLNNVKNNLFDEINSQKPKKSILKVTTQGNSLENNPEEMYTDEQNKDAEEINNDTKNNCSISELLHSKKLHNSIDDKKSHESLNSSGQLLIAQQNTNKQFSDITSMTNEKKNTTDNFIDSPLLFDDSIDLNKLTDKMNLEIMKILNSPVHQKLDQNNVNTKSRIVNTLINESSFIPDDWTNDYTSTYEYGVRTEDSNHDKTENAELNKQSVTNVKGNSLKDKNTSSKLLAEFKETDESEKRSELFENTKDDKIENAVFQDSINNEDINQNHDISDKTITDTDETLKDFQEINKMDDLCQTTSNDKNNRSTEHKGIKRKLDQTQEYVILNGKEPIIYVNKIDDKSLKRRKVNKKSISKNTRKRTLSNNRIISGKVMSNKNKITESETNNLKTDNKVVVNENNQQLVVKICRIENQNFKDISSAFSPHILEKLKTIQQEARIKTNKTKEQTEENQTEVLNNSASENLNKGDEMLNNSASENLNKGDEMLNNSASKNLNKGDEETIKNLTTENKNDFAVNEDIDNSNDNSRDLNVLLSKLKDSARITMRRKTVKKWDKPLAAITEDQADESSSSLNNKETEHKATKKVNKEMQNPSSNKSHDDNLLAEENEINKSTYDCQSQPIYLKPGKSWTRSLSIINHFHDLNSQNLEELAIGRGKNWRHSVQSVLNMQPEGTLHNLSNNEEERDFHLHSFSTRVSARRETNPFSLVTTSPSRVSRFSMRIIPDGKRSTLTDDFVTSQRSSTISNRTRKTSLSSRKTSLKIRRDTLIETEEDLIKSAKDIVLRRCKQNSYLSFSDCFPDSYIDNCSKIGEGVYGEVFLHVSDEGKKSVIKIIPIEGDELVNCEPQKKFHEILSEIIIAEELHKLRFGDECNTNGFVGVNRIMCVIGKYPQKLIDLWDIYDIKKKSDNDCPSMFKDKQLYIIFELAHGGQDLETFVFQNASESFSIFLQTAFTLAIAEKSLEFEHRDLHWGNILVSKTDETESTFKLQNNEFTLPTKGVKVSVIDFTLSRMSYQGCKIFNDLATDPSLFAAQGEYQFEIYRLMRNAVNNDWQQFNPYTNVLWLDYTLDKMITGAKYKKKTTKIHKTAIQQMKDLRKEIFNYSSAYDFVNNCNIVADRISV